MQRNKELYGEDAEEFNPERWLVSEKRNFEFEAAQFTFGVGPRVCLGKDVAIMELYKLLPEVSRYMRSFSRRREFLRNYCTDFYLDCPTL